MGSKLDRVWAPFAYSLQCASVPEQTADIVDLLSYGVSIECNAGILTDFDQRSRGKVFPRILRHDDEATAVQ